VPAALGVVDRRGQLGLDGVRPRHRPPAPGTHDGAAQRNRGSCRYVVGRMHEPRRVVGASGLI